MIEKKNGKNERNAVTQFLVETWSSFEHVRNQFSSNNK